MAQVVVLSGGIGQCSLLPAFLASHTACNKSTRWITGPYMAGWALRVGKVVITC